MKKTFEEIYYIQHTPWKRKLNLDNIKKFEDIKYNDVILFHFDFPYSVFSTLSDCKCNDKIFIAAINVCLRICQIIKTIYPYNKCYVIIHTKKKAMFHNTILSYETFRSIIDIIPNFAVINEEIKEDLEYFTQKTYRHIFYGMCNNCYNYYQKTNSCQRWSVINGNLIIK